MNAPYEGKFQMTQTQHAAHDGYDLVGIDSKEIHATVNGIVCHAGWENPDDHYQGFGQFVCIKGNDGLFYYFGHLSEIKCQYGDTVKITDVIGIEGNTGYSTGNHCHYCVRKQFSTGNAVSLETLSGIPNALGIYDDGYRPNKIQNGVVESEKKPIKVTIEYDDHIFSGLISED